MLHWGVICCLEKFITAVVVIYPLHTAIDNLIARAEEPLLPYPHTELILVMVALPSLLNSIFAWIVDNLIKDHSVHEVDRAVLVDVEEEMVAAEGRNLE